MAAKTVLDRIDTRSFIAIALTISMIALTFVLALNGPETDAFKVLLGAMLTVGFASAIGWYFNSNAGSDKKDDNQAIVAQELAKKVPVASVVNVAPPASEVVSWWTRLTNDETTRIMAAGDADDQVRAFIIAAKDSRATPVQLADLVTKGLLTPERSAALLQS